MSINLFFERIAALHFLVHTESTGSRDELAIHLGVSNATLHNTMNFMKDKLGASFKYNAIKRTYYYTCRGRVHLLFKQEKEIACAVEILETIDQLDLDLASCLKMLTILKSNQ